MSSDSLTYKGAGVDIEEADKFVEYISKKVKGTFSAEVMGNVGGFASFFDVSKLFANIKEPVLLSSTDGVGTKLMVAQELGIHKTIGIDLVAMCVNDLLVHGARPLFFLDYIATGKLEQGVLRDVMDGIVEGCRIAKVSLVGGETAEMPDMYENKKYDLAGFVVGVADKSNLKPELSSMRESDYLVGIQSSGFHSNGYSLLRKLPIKYDQMVDDKTFGKILIQPTFIYRDVILEILDIVKGMAHITGGGLAGNVARVIPDELCAEIDLSSWQLTSALKTVKNCGVKLPEMLKTFNMGIGLVCITDQPEKVMNIVMNNGYNAYNMGRLVKRSGDGVIFKNNFSE